ncbi:Phospholipase-like protein [Hirschfeldia incana]|nr:Phospholipase-like protein [Hirschfeldia incana]
MSFNQKAHPDCVYSDNPFHECASACLEKIAQGHVKKKTKKQGLKALSFSGSFGRKKNESYPQPLTPLSARPYQNGGGSFGNANSTKVHHAVAVKNKTVSDTNKSFSSSSSDDFFKHKPEKKLSQIILLSPKKMADKSKPVSPKPGIQEKKIEAGSETTSFNFLGSPILHGKESSDDYTDDEEEENNNEIGVELDLESVMSDTIVSIGKYRVRSGLAAILRAIIEKHGDIAQNCKLESGSMRSRYLECLCSLMQELKSTPVGKLTKVKVKEMLAVLKDLESVNIDVSWLRLVLEEFARSQEDVKSEIERQEGLLKAKREELEAEEADLVRMEEEVAKARAWIEETRAMMVEIESEWVRMEKTGFKMEKFKGKTFIDELL